jgi:hypothetical protein
LQGDAENEFISRGGAEGAEDEIVEDALGREVHHCDLCGAAMIEVHCKLVCGACGYVRDCSDP